MSYLADPGGNFASDVHRRTLAHLPLPHEDPTTIRDLFVRMVDDKATDFADEVELNSVLLDLETDGDAESTDAAEAADAEWKQTNAGHEVLAGPIASDGGRRHE